MPAAAQEAKMKMKALQCPEKAGRAAENTDLVKQGGVEGIVHRHDAGVGVSGGGRQAGIAGLLDVHNVDLRGCCGARCWRKATCTEPEVQAMQPGAACVVLMRERNSRCTRCCPAGRLWGRARAQSQLRIAKGV